MRRVSLKSTVLRLLLACALTASILPHGAAAQNLFEFLFGGGPKQPQQQQRPAQSDNPIADFFADPFGVKEQQTAQRSSGSGGGGPAFCVRSCDGKYFPLARNAVSPVQMCQAFCPATATKVYFGSTIGDASASAGERYADSDTAFAFRKAMRADCTCTGRGPAGLAAVDLSLDNSLRPGDVIATNSGLVAYAGDRGGGSLDFTPVASYPGLTADVRNRLGEMKVSADQPSAAAPTAVSVVASPARPVSGKAKRAEIGASIATPR